MIKHFLTRKKLEDLPIFFVARKFFMTKNLSKKPSMRLLPEAEKLEFLKTSVSWIESKDILDTCFVLNFGYEFHLPWPQVSIRKYKDSAVSKIIERYG